MRDDHLSGLVAAILERPARADVQEVAQDIVARHGDAVAGVLFYGSGLRDETDSTAILDLYVLVDDCRSVFRHSALSLAARLLPPNVLFLPSNAPGNAGFKVAVIEQRAFRARLGPESRDSTLWARFCQPAILVRARDAAARDWIVESCVMAVETALYWSARLGPAEGVASDYWRALFQATYAAELRVEKSGRADAIVAHAEDHYTALLAESGTFVVDGDHVRPRVSPTDVARARRVWNRRCLWGKFLSIARLGKAAFTFAGGGDYIAAKLARHADGAIVLGPWQRRHPLLAAPFVLASLHRRGIVR